ncbi:DUF6491 family protein [Thermodesulfobacteriota bacterium]
MMRSLIKTIMALILILMVSACASTPIQISGKYMLDNQLQRAGRPKPAFSDWGDTEPGMGNPAERDDESADISESMPDYFAVMKERDTVVLDETKNEWIKVDNQSFVIRSIKNEYYLLVLDSPAINLMTTNTITFQLISNSLRARADYIDLDNIKYLIERIYKVNNREDLYFITNQILTQL